MAASDSFHLLYNQIAKSLQENYKYAIDAVVIVGTWYLIRFSIDFGYYTFIHYSRTFTSTKNFVKHYGRWAVITGCTSGIGREFSRQLAEKGMNVVLLGRNKELCEKESRYLQQRYGIHTLIIMHDFCNASVEQYSQVAEQMSGKEIGMLINCAGVHYDHPMQFTEVGCERLMEITNVNMTGVVMLTQAIVPFMISRRRGLIVNVSSGAGWYPGPLITLYSASKAFVSHFSKSLDLELRDRNIHVQALEPLYISTRMVSFSTILHKVKWFNPDPEHYVRNAIKSFGRTKHNTGYYPHTLQMLVLKWMPRWLSVRISTILQSYLHAEGLQRKFKTD